MLFGFSNIATSFQNYINKILAKKLDIFIVVYLDDILIYIENPGQLHVEIVRWILEQLWKYSLYTYLKKCHFIKMRYNSWASLFQPKALGWKKKRSKL